MALERAIDGGDAARSASLFGSFRRHRLAVVGLAMLAGVIALSLLGPLFAPDPHQANIGSIYERPSSAHLFGTDHLGRDLFARVLAGGQLSLLVALLATLMAGLLGILYGLASGMGPRWLDHLMMQVLDTLLSIPVILIVILIQATGELSLLKITIAIALVSWMGTARIVRAECLRLMGSDFIRAALAAGAGRIWLVSRHLLPNIAAPLLVVLTVSVGQAVILEATLSFLNLGVPATVPSWGNLLGNGLSAALNGAWWNVLFPGLMIVFAVLSVNLIGDGLSDIADPRNRIRETA
jgi:peptide/nickel transport system permease protein